MAERVIINHFFCKAYSCLSGCKIVAFVHLKMVNIVTTKLESFQKGLLNFFLQSALGICGLGSLQACVFWI